MSRSRRHRGASAPDSQLHSSDPDVLFADGRRRMHERKEKQLCAQAKRAIALTLEGECQDEVLAPVVVGDVVFDNGQLVVVVRARRDTDLVAIRRRLDVAKGVLRSAVAATIHRKRTPSLAFVVLPEEVPQ